jgi:hypothetical protein
MGDKLVVASKYRGKFSGKWTLYVRYIRNIKDMNTKIDRTLALNYYSPCGPFPFRQWLVLFFPTPSGNIYEKKNE